jgi:hypothetical protein
VIPAKPRAALLTRVFWQVFELAQLLERYNDEVPARLAFQTKQLVG